MAFKLGDLFWFIKGDTKDIDGKLKDTDKKVGGLQGSFGKLAGFLKGAFVVAAVAGIAKVSKELINAASDAEETRNKFNVTFQDVKEEADAASTALADGFGLSSQKAQQLLSDTGDLLTGFGFTGESALDLSTKVNELAVDLASFTNFSGGAEGASAALTKGLLGEREAMKSLGISILEVDVKAKVLEQAQQGLTFETERQAKAFATLTLAQEQSKNAIGDFERSEKSFANQSRIAKSEIENLAVELGKNVLPIATGAISVFAQVTGKLAELAAASNAFSEAAKAVKNGTASAAQELEVLNAKLIQQEKTLKSTAGLQQVNSAALEEQIRITKQQIAAVERKAEAERRAAGARQLGDLIAAEAAEADAKRAEEEATRAAQRIKDIEFRNEIWGRTEEARIAAIQAEIAELETFKASDEKAQEALAFLREELEGLIGDTETQTQATDDFNSSIQTLNGEGILPLSAAEKEMWRSYGEGVVAAKAGTEELAEELIDVDKLTTDFITSSLSGFQAVGAAIYNGADAAAVLGSAVLSAGAEILNALGAELAARAAISALAGDVAGAVLAGAGAAAAFTASGVISAAASDISASATPSAPATPTTPTAGTTAPTPTASRGGGGATYKITINNLISTGKEADIRAAVRAQAPYIVEELINRGDFS